MKSDLEALKVSREFRGLKAIAVSRVHKAPRENKDLRGFRESRVCKVSVAPRESWEIGARRVKSGRMVLGAQLANRGFRALKAIEDYKVKLDPLVSEVLKESLEFKALRGMPERLGRSDQKALEVRRDWTTPEGPKAQGGWFAGPAGERGPQGDPEFRP